MYKEVAHRRHTLYYLWLAFRYKQRGIDWRMTAERQQIELAMKRAGIVQW